MDTSATSNSSSSRTVTASNNSSRDRATQSASETKVDDSKSKDRANEQRAAAQRNQQKRDDERRLEGRLVNYGQKKGDTASDYKQVSYNRSRVDDAYKAPKNDVSNAHQQQRARDNEAIDIVI